MQHTRPPAVAGSFYPGQRQALFEAVARLLAAAPHATADAAPKALVVPHAGYVYSGPTAAAAYARLLPWREQLHRASRQHRHDLMLLLQFSGKGYLRLWQMQWRHLRVAWRGLQQRWRSA